MHPLNSKLMWLDCCTGEALLADTENLIVSVVLNSRLDTEIGGASDHLIEEMSKVKLHFILHCKGESL